MKQMGRTSSAKHGKKIKERLEFEWSKRIQGMGATDGMKMKKAGGLRHCFFFLKTRNSHAIGKKKKHIGAHSSTHARPQP